MSSNQSVRDKLNQGEYTNKMVYPSPATAPAVLRKMAKDLSSVEIAALAEAKRI